MELKILENKLKVVKLKNDAAISEIVWKQGFYSITRTDEELSIVVDEDVNIESDKAEYNWRAIRITGILDFSLIGILAKISTILAQAKISIFAISTYNTDYILIKTDQLDDAIDVLRQNGYQILQD